MHQHEAEDCVRLVPIFQTLAEGDITSIAKLVRDQTLKAGDFLFTEGTAADRLYILAHGQAKVTQSTAAGREQLLRVLGAGDFDGEGVLFTKGEHTTTATALTPLSVCTISQRDFQALLKSTPALALNVLNALGRRVVALEAKTTAQAVASVSERLANYLVETAGAIGKPSFDLPLKKKDLAQYLGTTPETISRKLASFEDAGLIRQSGRQHIEVLDADGLALQD
ncbi:Crp/Fnr family transcriptional regulator [Lacticaseibacillus camelliae]|uniref:Transcription regulator n=1 Tax=Lacticaseibacillus camelliae DSM 22697 = JCM 13995 TaxID=1423730 RepID=A0A0R2FEC5_9LACO|nr:Crp/Fnr family transcriptional regulator [Lacticaseibacillus camelliae]KRN25926.1 transcription regulator [Lacticaseibacillus camelliae DSM 22697 = JCM 13995]